MPRSYGQAMAEATEGSSGDFVYFIAGCIMFFIYKSIWEKVKKTQPDNLKILLATIITLVVFPFIWLFYLIVFFFAWAVVSSVREAITKH